MHTWSRQSRGVVSRCHPGTRSVTANRASNKTLSMIRTSATATAGSSTTACRNCKYFRPDPSWRNDDGRLRHGLCLHDTSRTFDLVTGEAKYDTAASMRELPPTYHHVNTKCGPEGTFFVVEEDKFRVWCQEQNPSSWIEAMLYAFLSFFVAYVIVAVVHAAAMYMGCSKLV